MVGANGYAGMTLVHLLARHPGVEVRAGDAIALLDGRVVASASDAVAALVDAAQRLREVSSATLYAGAQAEDGALERAEAALREALPGVELEVRRGGQPHYPFIVQAE